MGSISCNVTKFCRNNASNASPGEYTEMNSVVSLDFFLVSMPCRLTSSGSPGSAAATRFWTRTLAMSRSVPISNTMLRFIVPSSLLVLVM